MSATDPLIGKQLGDYTIIDLLGQGGMARVYRGYDATLERYAAVKVIEPHLVLAADSQEYRERFLREARAIARLSHPGIVGIFQFGDLDSRYYMAMAFIDGQDLRHILRDYRARGKLLSYALTLQIIRDIATALDYAHSQGVIHRDVKPSNIMVTPEGRAVLTDFGLALRAHEGTIGNTFGSVYYIAPEQAVSSAAAVPQSDLYALGVVLYEMLTGRVPFDDVSAMSIALRHISDPPPPPRAVNPDISPELEAVINCILSKEPEDRYPTGAALVAALESALAPHLDDGTRTAPPDALNAALPAGAIRPGQSVSTTPLPDWDSPASAAASKSRTGRLVTGGLLGLTLVVVLVLAGTGLLANDNAEATASAAATNTALAAIIAPATDTATPTQRATPTSMPAALIEVTSPPTETADLPASTPDMTLTGVALTMTARPPINAASLDDPHQVLLRYDGRALVLYNRLPDSWINVSEMVFTRTTGSGSSVTYRAVEWNTEEIYVLRPRDCLMVWTISYSMLPPDEFPAEICSARQAFRQTVNPFWVSNQPDATFDVRVRGETVATCPAVPGSFRDEARCLVPLPTLNGAS